MGGERANLAGMAGGTVPYVIGPGEGRFIDLGDFGMTIKASETETAGVISVLEAEEPPGFGPPIHVTTIALKPSTSSTVSTSCISRTVRSSAPPGRSSSFHKAPGTGFGLGTSRAAS